MTYPRGPEGAASPHSIDSHSDTTATGAELEELTDGSTTTLHNHADPATLPSALPVPEAEGGTGVTDLDLGPIAQAVVNYTPPAATLAGHFAGLDTALGAVGGGIPVYPDQLHVNGDNGDDGTGTGNYDAPFKTIGAAVTAAGALAPAGGSNRVGIFVWPKAGGAAYDENVAIDLIGIDLIGMGSTPEAVLIKPTAAAAYVVDFKGTGADTAYDNAIMNLKIDRDNSGVTSAALRMKGDTAGGSYRVKDVIAENTSAATTSWGVLVSMSSAGGSIHMEDVDGSCNGISTSYGINVIAGSTAKRIEMHRCRGETTSSSGGNVGLSVSSAVGENVLSDLTGIAAGIGDGMWISLDASSGGEGSLCSGLLGKSGGAGNGVKISNGYLDMISDVRAENSGVGYALELSSADAVRIHGGTFENQQYAMCVFLTSAPSAPCFFEDCYFVGGASNQAAHAVVSVDTGNLTNVWTFRNCYSNVVTAAMGEGFFSLGGAQASVIIDGGRYVTDDATPLVAVTGNNWIGTCEIRGGVYYENDGSEPWLEFTGTGSGGTVDIHDLDLSESTGNLSNPKGHTVTWHKRMGRTKTVTTSPYALEDWVGEVLVNASGGTREIDITAIGTSYKGREVGLKVIDGTNLTTIDPSDPIDDDDSRVMAGGHALALKGDASVYSTTIAAGSDAVDLPQATINVASTSGFPSAGTVYVATDDGIQTVTYTGTTGTSFTGGSGGTGTMSTGGAVTGAGWRVLSEHCPSYGDVYVSDTTPTAQTLSTPAGTYDVLTGFANDGADGIGLGTTPAKASNKVTVDVGGTYRVAFHASFGGDNNEVYTFKCYVNGAVQEQLAMSRKLGATGTDIGSASFEGLATVGAGEDVDVRTIAGSDGASLSISYMNLSVVRVGP